MLIRAVPTCRALLVAPRQPPCLLRSGFCGRSRLKRPGPLAAQIFVAWRARGTLRGRSWCQCDHDVARRPASRMVRTSLDMVHCIGAAGCRLLLLDAGCCFSTSLVSTNAGAAALRSCRFMLPRPFAGAVRQQDCSAAFVLIGQRAEARASARGRQRERAWRKGSPTWAKRLQRAAAAASNARWRVVVRHSVLRACREPVHACMRACDCVGAGKRDDGGVGALN